LKTKPESEKKPKPETELEPELLELREVVSKVGECLEPVGEVLFALLYGSRARGKGEQRSDVDVALFLSRRLGLEDLLGLVFRLAGCLRVREDRIDLLILDNSTPLELRYKVFRDGVLLFARDLEAYRRYRDESISMYLDFKVALKAARFGETYIKALKAEFNGA